jgi:HEAT repeat protein
MGRSAGPAVPAVTESLRDKDARVALPELRRLLNDGNHLVRIDAASSIGGLTEWDAALPTLIASLGDSDPDVRAAAAFALDEIGTPAAPALPALIECLGDENDRAGAGAAYALGAIGEPAVEPPIAAVRDEDARVRARACKALESVGEPAARAVPALTECLRDGDPKVRAAAAWALGAIGTGQRRLAGDAARTGRGCQCHTP